MALRRSLVDIDVNFWHWSVHWVDTLHNQHLWFAVPFSSRADIWLTFRCLELLSGAVALILDFISDVIQDINTSSVAWHFVVSKKRDQTLRSSNTFFVQSSPTCDCCPCHFATQLPTGCWNFVWRDVLGHRNGRLPSTRGLNRHKWIPHAPTRHRSLGQFLLLNPKAFHSRLLEE